MATKTKKATNTRRARALDAIELLTADHSAIEELFRRFDGMRTGDPKRKRELVEQISQALSVHAAIEEEILYPALRETIPTIDAEVGDALDDHRAVKESLARIESTHPSAETYDDDVSTLIEEVRMHVEEEEEQLFPLMRERFDAARLRELGVHLAARKELAPTEPRPNAPQTPPMNVVMNTGAALLDRAVGMAPAPVVKIVDLGRAVVRWEMRMIKRVLRLP